MHPASASSGADTNRHIGFLCGTIDDLMENYLDGPGEDQKFFLGSVPEGESDRRHLTLHKLEYNLLEESKVLACVLYRLGDSARAESLVFKLVHQYYDLFLNGTPVQFKCEEANCKIFSYNALRIVQFIKRCIANQ